MLLRKLLFTLLLLLLLLFTHTVTSYSDGPPPGRTGAPGELTCFNGYCHNSFQLNSGPGTPSLKSNIPVSGYVPGETYTIIPSVRHTSQQRFGFMSMAYSGSLKGSAGEIKLSEPDRTQIKIDDVRGRSYVTHDTAWATADSAHWTFEWVAPDAGVGNVTFYAAFVAADYSGNSSGDYVYTTQLSLNEDTLNTSLWAPLSPSYLSFISQEYKLILNWRLPYAAEANVSLTALDGKSLYETRIWIPAVAYSQRIAVPAHSTGIYLLSVRVGKWVYIRKILL